MIIDKIYHKCVIPFEEETQDWFEEHNIQSKAKKSVMQLTRFLKNDELVC